MSNLIRRNALVAGAAVQSTVVDLFAGAGGWGEALLALGHRAVGVESDKWACATARSAGHAYLQADVSGLDPGEFAPVWGLVASPPCQAYSVCGKHLGRFDKAVVAACARELAAGHDTRAVRLGECRDPRSLLTVEPLRWALALRPRWVAFEQVPAVLELWELVAGLLGRHGYHTTTGLLDAERYGVPQTRKRAFLLASLDGPVCLPLPTHRSYRARRREVPEGELGLLPWVSMADALGWEHDGVLWTNNQTHSGERPRGLCRSLTLPAFTVDTASGSWTVAPAPGTGKRGRTPRRRCGRECPHAWSCTHHPGSTRTSGNRQGHYLNRRERAGARITAVQTAAFQGFRDSYPWEGSRSQQFRQIGNAVCPPLARLVLAETVPLSVAVQAGSSAHIPQNGGS